MATVTDLELCVYENVDTTYFSPTFFVIQDSPNIFVGLLVT